MINKIIIFGDSILKGVTFDAERGYCLLKDRELSVDGCEVKNYSLMGATAARGLEIVKKRLSELDENTLAVLEFGGNDSDHDWEKVSEAPEKDHRPRTEPEEFKKLIGEMAALCESRGARVMTCSLPPISCERYVDRISRGRDKNAILRFLGDCGTVGRWQEYYGTLSEGWPRVELRPAFILRRDFNELIAQDGAHLTQKGFNVLRSAFRRSVESHLN